MSFFGELWTKDHVRRRFESGIIHIGVRNSRSGVINIITAGGAEDIVAAEEAGDIIAAELRSRRHQRSRRSR